MSSTVTTSFINDKSTVYTKLNLDFGKMRMRKKWILPGSAHKMGRKSAFFRVHTHVHLAGSGGMRMCLTLNGYGNNNFYKKLNHQIK